MKLHLSLRSLTFSILGLLACVSPVQELKADPNAQSFVEWAEWVGRKIGNIRCEKYSFETSIVKGGPGKDMSDHFLDIFVREINSNQIVKSLTFDLANQLTRDFSQIETKEEGVHFLWGYLVDLSSQQPQVNIDAGGRLIVSNITRTISSSLKLTYLGDSRWKVSLFDRGDSTRAAFNLECESAKKD